MDTYRKKKWCGVCFERGHHAWIRDTIAAVEGKALTDIYKTSLFTFKSEGDDGGERQPPHPRDRVTTKEKERITTNSATRLKPRRPTERERERENESSTNSTIKLSDKEC